MIYEDAKLQGNISQRRRNVRLAERSAAMSIFLSKNQLGMRDDFALSGKVDHEHTMLHRSPAGAWRWNTWEGDNLTGTGAVGCLLQACRLKNN